MLSVRSVLLCRRRRELVVRSEIFILFGNIIFLSKCLSTKFSDQSLKDSGPSGFVTSVYRSSLLTPEVAFVVLRAAQFGIVVDRESVGDLWGELFVEVFVDLCVGGEDQCLMAGGGEVVLYQLGVVFEVGVIWTALRSKPLVLSGIFRQFLTQLTNRIIYRK